MQDESNYIPNFNDFYITVEEAERYYRQFGVYQIVCDGKKVGWGIEDDEEEVIL